jgi:hypothetical protein
MGTLDGRTAIVTGDSWTAVANRVAGAAAATLVASATVSTSDTRGMMLAQCVRFCGVDQRTLVAQPNFSNIQMMRADMSSCPLRTP